MKYKFLVIIVFLIILNSSFLIHNCPCQWSQVLNNSGGTNTFLASASDSDFVYASTINGDMYSGLYRSSNNGVNWSLISLQSIGGRFLEKSGSNLAAITSIPGSLYVSTNQGAGWIAIGMSNCLDLYSSGNIVFCINLPFISKSTNSGINWIQLPLTGVSYPRCIASKDTFVFAGNQYGSMFRISQNTSSWITVNSGLPATPDYSIWDVKTLGQSVFCSIYATEGTGIYSGIYRTTNNGGNWIKVTSPSGYTYNLGHNIYVMDSAVLYCALNTLYLSTNNGNNWTSKFANLPNNTSVYTFTHKGDYVFIGTSNGVWRMPKTGFLTGIKNISNTVPENFVLEQNYPNPFNAVTSIRFHLPMDSRLRGNDKVLLKVFDLPGREVATLVNENLQPGTYEVTFNAGALTSGTYFYRLSAGDFSETKKLILIK